MDTTVFLAVLGAALCHAGWNAIIKVRLEPIVALSLISTACGIAVLPFLPLVGAPDTASWPFLAGSLAVHLVYYTALAEAYRTGDLGQVYPIARGSAPLMTAAGATFFIGEQIGPTGWGGLILLTSGIVMLSFRGGREVARFETRAVGFAFLTAVSIAVYTVIDGVGARVSGNVGAYIVWLFLLDAAMMLLFGFWQVGARRMGEATRDAWVMILLGGALSTASYAIAIWAMTKAPVALVAALRETSVLFAAAIGIVLLGEPVIRLRIVSAAIVLLGLVVLRLR